MSQMLFANLPWRLQLTPTFTVVPKAQASMGQSIPGAWFVVGPWFGLGKGLAAYSYKTETEANLMAQCFNEGFVPSRCEGCGQFITEIDGKCSDCLDPWVPCSQAAAGCTNTVPKGSGKCSVCQKLLSRRKG